MERVGAQAISSGDVGYELEFMKGLFVRLILWAGEIGRASCRERV